MISGFSDACIGFGMGVFALLLGFFLRGIVTHVNEAASPTPCQDAISTDGQCPPGTHIDIIGDFAVCHCYCDAMMPRSTDVPSPRPAQRQAPKPQGTSL